MTQTPDNGGPVFPSEQGFAPDGQWNQSYDPGISLRDYFAAQALLGIVTTDRFVTLATSAGVDWDELVGEISYGVADAMLAARKGGAA